MEKMLENVKNLISPKVVIGVSGGADSMVLLFLLLKAREDIDFELAVVHVEHGIRGEESKADAKFVKEFCDKNSVFCEVISTNIPSLAKKQKQTVEQCARNFRMQQFERYTNKGYRLFLAHNKNDQVETVLMHIFRGSGIDGAKGISQSSQICRPLLDFSKQQIETYAKEKNIPFVHDSTNDCNDYARNYLRNVIIPQIEQIYPNAIENIDRFSKVCSQCEILIDSQICNDWIKQENNCILIDRQVFSQNILVAAKIIKRAYNMCGQWADLESKHIYMLQDFERTCKNGANCNLPHNVVAELRVNHVVFYKKTAKNSQKCDFIIQNTVLPNDKVVKICKFDGEIEFQDGIFYLDYHKIPQNAEWRTRKLGDVFQKLGSRGKKKLNDYYTDKKMTKLERDNTIVLASGSTILLVLGHDISENVKIDSNTSDVIKIEF